MGVQYGTYEVKRGDDIGEADFHNRRWRHIDGRVASLEDTQAAAEDATAVLIQQGLYRIDETIRPVINEVQAALVSIPALFVSPATASLSIGNGTKTVVIAEANRPTFVPTEFVIIEATADSSKWMSGRVTSFDREAGDLVVAVTDYEGSGTITDWTVSASGRRGATGAAGVPGLIYRGAYAGGTAYVPGDVISYDRSAWVCLANSTGNTPPTLPTTANSYWRALAEHGSDGSLAGAIPVDVTVVATSGQTSFTIPGGYTPGASKMVFLNGNLLPSSSYTATSGTAIVLGTGATTGDKVRLLQFETFAVSEVVQPSRQISTGTGLTGGGDLSADRTLAVDLTALGLVFAALVHSHSNASGIASGFMSSTDKSKLDALPTNSTLTSLLGALAPLASPALSGTPTAPTAAPGTNTTQLATTAFVAAAVTALINAAPGALDTLDELAAALGDDANFAATITTALAGKQPLATLLTAIAGLTIASGDLIYGSGVNAVSRLAKGTDGQVLALAAGVPAWTSAAAKAAADLAVVAGDIVYGSGANTLARLAKGTNGQILTLASGLPSWADAPATGVAIDNGALAVGSFAILRKTNSGSVNSGSTINGSNLSPFYYQSSGSAWANSGSASGSWRNVSGITIIQSDAGLFQRIS